MYPYLEWRTLRNKHGHLKIGWNPIFPFPKKDSDCSIPFPDSRQPIRSREYQQNSKRVFDISRISHTPISKVWNEGLIWALPKNQQKKTKKKLASPSHCFHMLQLWITVRREKQKKNKKMVRHVQNSLELELWDWHQTPLLPGGGKRGSRDWWESIPAREEVDVFQRWLGKKM